MSKYSHYGKGDPEWEAICATWPSDHDTVSTVKGLRTQREEMRKSKPKSTTTNLQIQDHKVPVKDGEILVRTYVPESTTENPLVVFYHGGGYVLGNLETSDEWCRSTCVLRNVTVVNVNYRLAPEHPFPIGVEDSYEALKWSAAHATEFNADVTKGLIIGGSSAGANFSAVLSLWARDDPDFKWKITGQLLGIPQVCDYEAFPAKWKDELLSHAEITNAPILTPKISKLFRDNYSVEDPTNWKRSPLLVDSHANLPPAVIQVAGFDPLRDEGILYAKVLQDSGVEVKLHIYPAAPHGLASVGPHTAAAKKYNKDGQDGIEWLLSLH